MSIIGLKKLKHILRAKILLNFNERTTHAILLMLKDDLEMSGLPQEISINFAGQILSDQETLRRIYQEKTMPAYITIFQHKNNNNEFVWNWRFILDHETLTEALGSNTSLLHVRYLLNKAVKIQEEILKNETDTEHDRTLN